MQHCTLNSKWLTNKTHQKTRSKWQQLPKTISFLILHRVVLWCFHCTSERRCCTPKENTSQISNCSHQFSKKAEGGRRKHFSHPCCLTQGNADLGIRAWQGCCSHLWLSCYGAWNQGWQTTTQTQVPTCTSLRVKGFCTNLIQTSAFLIRYAETR